MGTSARARCRVNKTKSVEDSAAVDIPPEQFGALNEPSTCRVRGYQTPPGHTRVLHLCYIGHYTT